jgi:hypothetical protein
MIMTAKSYSYGATLWLFSKYNFRKHNFELKFVAYDVMLPQRRQTVK